MNTAKLSQGFLDKKIIVVYNTGKVEVLITKENLIMYCKSCGNIMENGQQFCPKCGCPAGTGINYCPQCGSATLPGATICSQCGIRLNPQMGNTNNTANRVYNPAAKSKVVAGILGILLGSLGIHNFYLGFTNKAVAQLLITVLSCGALSIVSAIWGLVEGIYYLIGHEGYTADAQGVPLND